MNFVLENKRKAVISERGHILVLGGPGSGKTTLAILKAQARMNEMKPGQVVLFLSFSKAAVQQIMLRCRGVLSREELLQIDIRTYHSFCWELLKAHGRALHGMPVTMLTPGREGMRRTQFTGDWNAERRRLLEEESCASFDMFAYAATRLVEESSHIRNLIADLYPLIILDEFQDTDDDQWRMVSALSSATSHVFLADPEQRIYDFRAGVRVDRLDILRKTVMLKEYDLERENFRSPASDILRYANAVLAAQTPPRCKDVEVYAYRPFQNIFNSTVHFHVRQAFADLRRRGIADPSVAVLAASNDLIADISELLTQPHNFGRKALAPIIHDVAWDAESSAAAALAVAALLEQSSAFSGQTRAATLSRVADFWLLKKDWCEQHGAHGKKTAGDRATRMLAAAALLLGEKIVRASGPRLLADYAFRNSGYPVADWRAARDYLQGHDDLREIASQARLVRLSQENDALAVALTSLWCEGGTYVGATKKVAAILDQQRLIGAERPPRGCMLMTLHKSKGKEFDGVVIVEGFRSGALLKPSEAPRYEHSRRVLRVGITRARYLVRIIRPNGAGFLFA